MTEMAVISEEQAEALAGQFYGENSRCAPVKDGLGRWVISIEEMQGLGLELEIVDWIEPKVELELPNLSALTDENE